MTRHVDWAAVAREIDDLCAPVKESTRTLDDLADAAKQLQQACTAEIAGLGIPDCFPQTPQRKPDLP